jgi:hypothetical protein
VVPRARKSRRVLARRRGPPGHHEKDYETHFGPLWYWFPHKNAAFLVLYSDEGDPKTNRKGWGSPDVNRFSETQLKWVAAALKEAAVYDHVFLFMHHPRWLSYYKGSNWDAVHALLKAAGNVSAVFAGHIHRQHYSGPRDGIEYYTLATTGGGIPGNMPGTGYLHHMNVVTVREDGIRVATVPVGKVLDPKEMTADRWAEVDAIRGLRPQLVGEPVVVLPDGAADGRLRFRLRNPGKRPVLFTAELDGRDGALWFSPDHEHGRIEAGETAEVVFRYRRDAGDALAGFEAPRVMLGLELLASTARITIPERAFDVDATLRGAPPPVVEARNRALRLPGTRACVRVGGDALRLPDGPFTVEGWMKPGFLVGRRAFLAKTERSEYGIFVSDGIPSFSVHLDGKYVDAKDPETKLQPGRWQHVAGVFDGNEVRLYVDGRLVARKAGSGARTRNGLPFLIGADPDRGGRPVSGFVGEIDEVRVSRTARYAGDTFEPVGRFDPDPDTELQLRFDRRFGPFLLDASGHDRHGFATSAEGVLVDRE